MARTTQLVGIIELDADPDLDAHSDENLGQTLRRLRSVWKGHEPADEDTPPVAFTGFWHVSDHTVANSRVIIAADLGQLSYELQRELSRLMDRLLLIDS